MNPLQRWRMQRHLRGCPACSAQTVAEAELLDLLREESGRDTPAEAAAVERVTRAWEASIPAPAERRAPARAGRRFAPRMVTASAAVMAAVGLFVVSAVTAPGRALAKVQGAMDRVRVFHVRMEMPHLALRYEAWGEREVGARVEEWEGSERTMIIVDDGERMRRYSPVDEVIHESRTRLRSLYRHAGGFDASRLLRQAAKGKLFKGQEWLGEATAREVARVRREGRWQRRIQVDLKNGFFERVIIYADAGSDELLQANLYTDSRSPDEEPFARVFFDYPKQVDPKLFRLEAPRGTSVRFQETDLALP